MITREVGIPGNMRLFILLFTLGLLLQTLVGCGADPHDTALPGKQTAPPTPVGQTPEPLSPTPTFSSSALHGPTNFLLRTPLNFSSVSGTMTDASGTTTPINANTVKAGITGEFEHLLFVVDSDDNVNVYSPGAASPIAAQVSQLGDGRTDISYTQRTNSETNTITLAFDGVLVRDQIKVAYRQQYSPTITSNTVSSDVTVTFTTRVRWVAANQIPTVPQNGRYQIAPDGGIVLSWSAGHNAVAYNVYRLIPDQDQQFKLLSTVKDTSYTDKSAEARHNARATTGIGYAIFSVGPTGVQNPIDILISVAAQ
ncbi:MAG: hypothetical protein J2P37_10365 [Ktedonobacteraceae bacterium]|nr:hypothetical protein [Ktedonobacteraceae bacterium]MBO0792528.1 hypothetical protein [Ktedonobacteraceae bacterium]